MGAAVHEAAVEAFGQRLNSRYLFFEDATREVLETPGLSTRL